MKSENKIYFIDSSALITVNRYYPSSIFPDLWKHIDELFKKKIMVSHKMVYDEIVPSSGAKDDIGKLISKYKSSFYPITKRQTELVSEILKIFPQLIDP